MDPFAQNSIESDVVPPDRSSSSSAPPALQLASESLFAFRVEYAKIFSDIRAHEDYYHFYESNKEKRALPPPLEVDPFLYEPYITQQNFDEDEAGRRFFSRFQGGSNGPSLNSSASDLSMNQFHPGYGLGGDPTSFLAQGFQQMHLGNNNNPQHLSQQQFMPHPMQPPSQPLPMMQQPHFHQQGVPIPGGNASVWSPLPRKTSPLGIDSYPESSDSGLMARIQDSQKEFFNNSRFNDLQYSSSPSAQTALNTAHFIWRDEEQSSDNQPQQPQQKQEINIRNLESQVHSMINNHSTSNTSSNPSFGFNVNGPQSLGSVGVTSPTNSNGLHNSNSSINTSPTRQMPSQQSGSGLMDSVVTSNANVGTVSPRPISGNGGNTTIVSSDTGGVKKTPTGAQPKGTAGKQSGIGRGKGISSQQQSPAKSSNHDVGSVVSPRGSGSGSGSSTATAASSTSSASGSGGSEYYTSLDQLIGRIYTVSKDQQGCRFLQKKLEEADPSVAEVIFSEVYDHINELMTDPFGNYLCQKLLEHCNDQERFLIVQRVSPDLVYISKNMHGTRAVQKMIECLSSPAQIEIVKKALSNSVVELIQDLNGNHVIQRCLNRLSSDDNQFIYDAVTTGNNCVQVATHRHGCCVLQRCIDHASTKQKIQLIQEITKNALTLVQDPYGNYVVQYVLDLPFPDLIDNLIRSFFGSIRILATQKFSSNVIEKCLGVAGLEVKYSFVKELLSEKQHFLQLLQDPFANYVIQTALTIADPQQHHDLVEAIKPFLPQLRNTPYGKRIQSKIAKETGERAAGKR